jgi:hypothetical protein
MQLKVELFWQVLYNETLKDLVIGTLVPDCTVHKYTEAIYLRLQGVSDGDNYAALETVEFYRD